MQEERVKILGVGFDAVTMEQAVQRGRELLSAQGTHYVVTPNPEIVETCRADALAMKAVNGADLVLPDGIGVIYGARMRHTPLPARVPGIEFGSAMLAYCAETGKKVFLFGAKPGIAQAAALRLEKEHQGLRVCGTRDGYFSPDESSGIAAQIRESGAELVFVCLGAPKQEKWMAQFGSATGARLLLGLGGSLDVFAGVAQRAPRFYCEHNLEWFYRLMKNPSRVGRMMKLPLFLLHAAAERKA